MLTKTEFLRFLHCPQSAWLKANKPDRFPQARLSLYDRKLIADGYEVESWAQRLFPGGVKAPGGACAATGTKALMEADEKVIFQATFESPEGLHARCDILERTDEGETILHEVKSSTAVRNDAAHNHVKDVCFQVIALAQAGVHVDRMCLVHLNRNYIKQGEIDPAQLLTLTEITQEVAALREETENEIKAAMAYLNQAAIDESSCSCLDKTRGNRCESFSYFNGELPQNSIYELSHLRPSMLQELREMNIQTIRDIPEDFELSGYQDMQRFSLIEGKPVIDYDAIEEELNALNWPLHFIDYETFSSAVPAIDRTQPYSQVPFQYSLHVLHRDGTLQEFGFIADRLELPDLLLKTLRKQIAPSGSLVSWHASFEKQRNSEMALIFAQYEDFLNDMNRRTYDLERIFRTSYVDAKFGGSSSIKNVLPVLLPQFSYAALAIQDGTSAMEAWLHMTTLDPSSKERAEIRRALMEYCTLDTLAMVEIYRVLRKILEDREEI